MKVADTVAAVVASLVGLGIAVAVFAPNSKSPQVFQNVFGGSSQLFGTFLSPFGASTQRSS